MESGLDSPEGVNFAGMQLSVTPVTPLQPPVHEVEEEVVDAEEEEEEGGGGGGGGGRGRGRG